MKIITVQVGDVADDVEGLMDSHHMSALPYTCAEGGPRVKDGHHVSA